jgi:hypothetical protein
MNLNQDHCESLKSPTDQLVSLEFFSGKGIWVASTLFAHSIDVFLKYNPKSFAAGVECVASVFGCRNYDCPTFQQTLQLLSSKQLSGV